MNAFPGTCFSTVCPELPASSLTVIVVDASNLQRNLYYATQVIELGHPTIVALNMVDVAEANDITSIAKNWLPSWRCR